MIELHRIHGNGTFLVNPDLVETIEACPDTVVTLVNKHRYVVEESIEEFVSKVITFRARIASAAGTQGDHSAGARYMAVQNDEEQAA